MNKFFKTVQFKVFIFVLCALLSGTVIAIATTDSVSPAARVVGFVLSPVQKLTSAISQRFNWFSSSFAGAGALQDENERLRQQIEQYQNQVADYNDIKRKLSSYEVMLGVKEENLDFALEPANVIGSDPADAFSSLIIDKGSSHGVSVNDPVIFGSYLVGVVHKVNQSYSVVQTILNPAVNVSAIESKSRETAYVTTDTAKAMAGNCVLNGINRDSQISPGGIVLTSGIGGIYPKGLIIGTVTQVSQSEYDISSYAVIKPGAKFGEIEDVFVITSFNGQGVKEISDQPSGE